MSESKELAGVVADSLVGHLGRSVHLLEVVGGSENEEWRVGKWVVQRGIAGR